MIRLSGLAGSRPCSTSRCFCTLLISICSVHDPIGIGSASVPPLLMRSSSIARSAVRADRPTSSRRFLRPSSSSITVSGTTRSTSVKVPMQPGSAISTEVSRTARCLTAVAGRLSTRGRRSVTVPASMRAHVPVDASDEAPAEERPAAASVAGERSGSLSPVLRCERRGASRAPARLRSRRMVSRPMRAGSRGASSAASCRNG